jgi:hypothetical protein
MQEMSRQSSGQAASTCVLECANVVNAAITSKIERERAGDRLIMHKGDRHVQVLAVTVR